MAKFTFKTEKPTGPWRSFQGTFHYIKLQKKEVGSIGDSKPHTIRLMVVKEDIMQDGNKNCIWMWVKIAGKFESLQEAKDWLNIHKKEIETKYNLNKMEP